MEFKIDVPGCLLANLEASFLDPAEGLPAKAKAGPHLWTSSLPVLDCCLVFSLANNHIMDYGWQGLKATTRKLSDSGIRWLGAGESSSEAEKPLILDCDGIRYGILARCETQFGKAMPRRSGVATLDATITAAIAKLREEVDIIIVSVHAASEMCPWPSPECQKQYRMLIDSGADVVHGHHAHVPQGFEYYHGGIIFYGMGNLCVDPADWSLYPNTLWSLIAEISLAERRLRAKISAVSIRQNDRGLVVEPIPKALAEKESLYIQSCNRPLADPDLLAGLWQETAMRMYELHYADWLGFRKRENSLSIKTPLRQKVKALLSEISGVVRTHKENTSPDTLLLRYVLFACESHRDAIATALGLLSGELEDLRNTETRELADEMMPWSRGVITR